MVPRLALLSILLFTGAAWAEGSVPPDVIVEGIGLEDAATGAKGPFSPGTTVDATVVLRNEGSKTVRLRRLVLRTTSALDVADPASDGLDNDFDGDTDEADEAVQRRDEEGVALRYSGDGLPLAPDERMRHAFRVRMRDSALPGTSGVLSFSAGSTLDEGARSRPQRTTHVVPVPVTPPALALASSETAAIPAGSEPVLSAVIVFPGAILPDAQVRLDLPPALEGIEVEKIRFGSAIDCTQDPDPAVDADGLTLRLGLCRIDGSKGRRDRTLRFAMRASAVDADPHGTDAEIAAWRASPVTLTVRNGDVRLGRTVLETSLHGPLPRLDLFLPDATQYRTGDAVEVRLRVSNRGDTALPGPHLNLPDDATFRCETVTIADRAVPCEAPVPLGIVLAPGLTVEAVARLRLRLDALVEVGTAVTATLESGAETWTFPAVPLRMAPHSGPALSVAEDGDWRHEGRVAVATIGEAARLRISGTLPAGRYRGNVHLLARLADARTGVPAAPATLSLGTPDLRILAVDGSAVGETGEVSATTDPVWTRYVFPFDLRSDADSADEVRSFVLDVDAALADVPAMRSGRLLELTAGSTAYGDNTVAGDDWVEVLIAEPDLRLKLFALDEDRVIHPGEPLGVIALACNYGDSPAHGARLRIALPENFDRESPNARKRMFRVPLGTVQGSDVNDLPVEGEALAGSRLSWQGGDVILEPGTAPLPPDACDAIEISGSLGPDRPAASSSVDIVASLDEHVGTTGKREGRRYPAARTPPLRLRAPVIRFGPSTVIQLGDDRRIAHPVELEVPDRIGPYRVSLVVESSTGLDWALFERRPDGRLAPWLDGTAHPQGTTLEIVMRTTAPDRLPLGWVDTTRLRAVVLTRDGRSFASTLRLVIRSGTGSARAIATDKRIALDRDCDGVLGDELAQDAMFEPGKDAVPGDCVVVRIGFENAGTKEVERILIRDAIAERTTLVPDSPNVRIAPEPLDAMREPDPSLDHLEWEFEGLFRPGAVGEVEYRLRLEPISRSFQR